MITLPTPFPLPERRTLRSWLSGVMRSFDPGCDGANGQGTEPAPLLSARTDAGPERHTPPSVPERRGGEVVPFPVQGEALLVNLAEVLRRHVAARGLDHDRLWLTISRCPHVRLSIDGAAYVDYLSDGSTFQAAIEAGPDTKVILKTTNFDALASFVTQYVNERLLEPASVEAAP